MQSTDIEWVRNPDGSKGHVWNPVTGCTKVSDGCKHCYAERVFTRKLFGDRAFTDVITHADRLSQPLKRKKPTRVFVNSMSDLFHETVPFEFIDKVFAVMALAHQHTFIVLTKRPERMGQYLAGLVGEERHIRLESALNELGLRKPAVNFWPLPNVQLGVSVEDQKTADERIPLLLATPAAVRVVSYEPALGPVDLSPWLRELPSLHREGVGEGLLSTGGQSLDWVIVGGESGPKARPMHPDWARSVRDQCQAANVPFFFKQWGEWGAGSVLVTTGEPVFREFPCMQTWINKASTWVNGGTCIDLKGRILKIGKDFQRASDEGCYPVAVVHRVGKNKSGRFLDGVEHNETPISTTDKHR